MAWMITKMNKNMAERVRPPRQTDSVETLLYYNPNGNGKKKPFWASENHVNEKDPEKAVLTPNMSKSRQFFDAHVFVLNSNSPTKRIFKRVRLYLLQAEFLRRGEVCVANSNRWRSEFARMTSSYVYMY